MRKDASDLQTSSEINENAQILQLALNALPLSINIKDSDGRYKFVNQHQAENAGRPANEIVGKEVGVVGGENWKRVVRERDCQVLKTGKALGPIRDDFAKLFGLDGHWVTFKAPFSLISGAEPDHIITISFDVTPFVEAENLLRSAAYTDALTGLPNRRWFDQELRGFPKDGERANDRMNWILMVDIDHFKSVNDTNGHEVGDAVLQETAIRLRKSIRACDTAARIGGEEFVVLVTDTCLETVREIAERLRLAFEDQPMAEIEHSPSITVSIGAAAIDQADPRSALKLADDALYKSKNTGRNRITFANF